MRELAQLLNETHRYFPEWADRPQISGPAAEAGHNSYPAGGYSEEFGYRVSVDQPPVFSPLEGDHFRPNGGRGGMEEARGARTNPIYACDSAGRPSQSMQPIHVIRVGERTRKAARHDGLATKLTSFWAMWSAHPGLEH